MNKTVRVTVWNEYRHEKKHEGIAKIYPEGIHNAIGITSKISRALKSAPQR